MKNLLINIWKSSEEKESTMKDQEMNFQGQIMENILLRKMMMENI